jgi:hypothetical protein
MGAPVVAAALAGCGQPTSGFDDPRADPGDAAARR